MHSFDGSGGTKFHFNADGSGLTVVSFAGAELTLPARDLLEFAAKFVRQAKQNALEQQSDAEVLGIHEAAWPSPTPWDGMLR